MAIAAVAILTSWYSNSGTYFAAVAYRLSIDAGEFARC
jgi:hypothetical protein